MIVPLGNPPDGSLFAGIQPAFNLLLSLAPQGAKLNAEWEQELQELFTLQQQYHFWRFQYHKPVFGLDIKVNDA